MELKRVTWGTCSSTCVSLKPLKLAAISVSMSSVFTGSTTSYSTGWKSEVSFFWQGSAFFCGYFSICFSAFSGGLWLDRSWDIFGLRPLCAFFCTPLSSSSAIEILVPRSSSMTWISDGLVWFFLVLSLVSRLGVVKIPFETYKIFSADFSSTILFSCSG